MICLKIQGGAMGRLLLILSFLTLAACQGGWDQDPFEGQNDNVKNAVPQGGNAKTLKPDPTQMQIDVASSTIVLNEGTERIIEVTSRLDPNANLTFERMQIPDLEELLPGATFEPSEDNPQVYELKLDVAEGTVPAGLLVRIVMLEIELYANNSGAIERKSREITFHVQRSQEDPPVIEKIDGLQSPYHEFDKRNFDIYVRDRSSSEGSLLALQSDGGSGNSALPYVSCKQKGTRVIGDLGLFRHRCTINLDSANITSSTKYIGFSAQAFSEFGLSSESFRRSFKVYSDAAKPVIHAPDKLEFTEGQTSRHGFVVVDPLDEGLVNAKFVNACADLPGEKTCRCRHRYTVTKTTVHCEMTWTPSQHGNFNAEIIASNTVNQGAGINKRQKDAKKTLILKVNKAPVVEKPENPQNPAEGGQS